MSLSRRGFFGLLAGGVVAAAAPELLVPSKSIFLPPAGGWIARNSLLTTAMITREALRILHQNLEFAAVVNQQFDSAFADSIKSIEYRTGRITVGSRPWRLA